MNLFRSEDHIRAWTLLGTGADAGVADPRRLVTELFTLPRYTRRSDADCLDHVGEHSAGLADALRRVSDDGWWAPT